MELVRVQKPKLRFPRTLYQQTTAFSGHVHNATKVQTLCVIITTALVQFALWGNNYYQL
jgi:hypothetical protein